MIFGALKKLHPFRCELRSSRDPSTAKKRTDSMSCPGSIHTITPRNKPCQNPVALRARTKRGGAKGRGLRRRCTAMSFLAAYLPSWSNTKRWWLRRHRERQAESLCDAASRRQTLERRPSANELAGSLMCMRTHEGAAIPLPIPATDSLVPSGLKTILVLAGSPCLRHLALLSLAAVARVRCHFCTAARQVRSLAALFSADIAADDSSDDG